VMQRFPYFRFIALIERRMCFDFHKQS